MFSWGRCLTKLFISVGFGFVAARFVPVGMSILMAGMVYSIISAWWYVCLLVDHMLWGSLLFIGVFILVCWGYTSPIKVIQVISILGLTAIVLGGVIADIWGMIQSIRDAL